jgi:DNA-binding MarR family transcriptional regulator
MSAEKDLKRVEDAVEGLGRYFRGSAPARRRAEIAGIALSRTVQRLLWFIVTDGPIRISDLARTAGSTDPIVSRQVSALEAEGLVERLTSDRDGRVSLVRATAEGRRAGRKLRQAADEIFREQMKGWSAKDLGDLAHLLERLGADLERA